MAASIYRHLWESSRDACFLLHCERDVAGRVTDFVFDRVNASGAAMLDLAGDAIVGRNLCEVVAISRDSALHDRYVRVAESGEAIDEECELNLAEIDARWIRQQVMATHDGIAIIARDITARKSQEFANRRDSVFLQTLVDSLPLLICVKSLRARDFGDVVVWNQAAERITGYSASDVVVHSIGAAVPPNVDVGLNPLDGRAQGRPPRTESTLAFVKRDGKARELRTISALLLDPYGNPEFVLGIADDVTELAAARQQMERHANHDALTGLPNRRLFLDRLNHALDRCSRSSQGLSLLFIDLDGFKDVNDSHGHAFGDALLKEVGGRIARGARATDTVCRLSGDEFTILMEDSEPASLAEAGVVARRIIDALGEPFELHGHKIVVTASIGISICPTDGTVADVLLRQADDALYHAKALGKNRYQYFSKLPAGRPAHGAVFNDARRVPGEHTSVAEVSSG